MTKKIAPTEIEPLIAALHEGVFEQPYWTSFLTRLRQLAAADYLSLVIQRADARYKDILLLHAATPGGELNAQSQSAAQDASELQTLLRRAKLPYEDVPPEQPYSLAEIVRPHHPEQAEYVKYLRDRRVNYALGVRIAEPDGLKGWLSLGRSKSDFAPGVRDLLARIAPHLSIAVRTLATIERERMRADIAGEGIQRLNFGWITFDRDARAVDMDAGAERLFRNTPGLTAVARGKSFPIAGKGKRALSECITAFAEKPNLRPRAIHLADEPWLDMLTAPIRNRASSRGVTPVAVGYVHGVGAASTDRCEQLMHLFALTRSEARLALALSHGKSLAEAAEDLKLTLETTRYYSKQIYAKTATRGQADLVRFILASVLAMA